MSQQTNDQQKRLATFFDEVKRNRSAELECILRPGKVDKYAFTALLQYLRSTGLEATFHDETLNVIFEHKSESYRYEIAGLRNIAAFCRTNKPAEPTRLVKKTWVEDKYPIELQDLETKVNLKNEVEIEEATSAVMASFVNASKLFRLKKRFSFKTEDGLFQFDLSVVKSARAINLVEAQLAGAPQKYEVEMEYIGVAKSIPKDTLLRSLLNHLTAALLAMDDDDYIVSANEKKQVLQNYTKLVGQQDSTTPRFVGPMPITLEKKNLFPPELGLDSILEGYTVTDKADGERHLFYIDPTGKVYLINNRLNVRFTGKRNAQFKNTLLDGEFVKRDRFAQRIKLFAIFDAYFVKGTNVATETLTKRLEKAKAVTASAFSGEDDFKVTLKTFIEDDVLKGSKALLDSFESGDSNYKIDGLIYTPKALPVGALFEKDNVKFGGSWLKTFKWKPAHENSIDFLVKLEKNAQGQDIVTTTEDGKKSKMVSLYVGFKGRYTEKFTPMRFLTNQIASSAKLDRYYPELFVPEDAVFKNVSQFAMALGEDGQLRCANGDTVTHNSVIEFSYDSTKGWKPNRARSDKTDGNDYNTALNIWRSIQNPVDTDMITGNKPVVRTDADTIDDDQYYNRLYSRDRSATKSMIDFHNDYVKNRSLIKKFQGKVCNVFDIACGKGNDVYKYLKNGITTVVGIDKSEDNIVNQNDGAYARILREKEKGVRSAIPANSRLVFLCMDASKTIDEAYIADLDQENKEVARILWGIQKPTSRELEPYAGLVAKGFGLAVCQFAIHYFFSDETSLENFARNLSSALAPGGYFIGTCPDGRTVDEAFRTAHTDQGGTISGEIAQRTVWSLRKMYDTFDRENPSANFGKRIDVYMETINQQITEFLVDFDLLKLALKRHGIHLLTPTECSELQVPTDSTGLFGELWKELSNTQESDRFLDSARKMSDAEKRYSFMNRWFIFKKDTVAPAVPPPPSQTKPRLRAPKKKAEPAVPAPSAEPTPAPTPPPPAPTPPSAEPTPAPTPPPPAPKPKLKLKLKGT
jgi:hypothetical protein